MRALALVALLTAGPALAVPTPEASSRKTAGDSRRDSGDNTGALAAYREALQISPDYIEAWEEVGKLYFEVKKFSEAAEAFQKAVEIDGSYANNWFNLALAARKAGDLVKSRDAFRRYLALKPEDTEARLRLADLLKQLGEREPAIKEYQAVVDAAEARTVAPALGEKAKESIALLRGEAAATSAGAAPPALPAVAAVMSVSTQPEAVKGVAVPPPAPLPAQPPPAQPPPTMTPLAVARALFEPSPPPSPALLDKLALGDRLQAAGDFRGALFAYQDAVYLDPRHAVARVKLGRSYWILRYVGQAEEQWAQAGQLAPNDPSIANMIEEARKAPRPAVAGAPDGSSGAPPGGNTSPTPQGSGAGPGEGPRVYKFVPEGAAGQPGVAPGAGGSTPGYSMPPAQPQGYAQPQYGQPQYPQPQGQPQYGQPQYGQPQYPQPQYGQPQYPQPQGQPQYGQPQYPQPQGQPQYGQPQYPQPQGQPQYGQQQYPPPQYGLPAFGLPAAAAYGAPPPAASSPEVPGATAQQAPPAPSAANAAAAQRYRAALSLYTQRDYLGAIAELDAAITLDPNLVVAYVARGSAQFGLGKYRQAAADYKAAIDLDSARAEPIWGLAEAQRMLKDPAAPDTYRRYAASVAGDVNEDRRARARKWATELSPPPPVR